jgi:hypothetical protein
MAHQASPAVEEEEDTVWTSVRRISTQITTAIVGEDDEVDEEGGRRTRSRAWGGCHLQPGQEDDQQPTVQP